LPQTNADERRYKFARITESVIGAFYAVYSELGFGFAESVYRGAMRIVLEEAGIPVLTEAPLKATFRGRVVGEFRADLLISGLVAVELKAVRSLDPIHTAQLLNYLRCSALEVGLLLNFGPRPEVRRLAFENARKRSAPAVRAD
jgi:GxxExxY protein